MYSCVIKSRILENRIHISILLPDFHDRQPIKKGANFAAQNLLLDVLPRLFGRILKKRWFFPSSRQVVKTTPAKTFLTRELDCHSNWDRREDRKKVFSAQWPTENSMIILDEMHKYKKWKLFVKGEYDTQDSPGRSLPSLTHRKMDRLAGVGAGA